MPEYNCVCNCQFSSERGFKYHLTKCDCGRTKDICKMERMRSPIINVFLDNLFISVKSLYITDDLDRFNLFFKEALNKIQRADMSYFIKDVKKNGIVLIKGLQDLTLRKKGDNYVSYEWVSITGDEFFSYIISYLNNRIETLCKENKYINYNLLKVDNVNQYLKELKKISK